MTSRAPLLADAQVLGREARSLSETAVSDSAVGDFAEVVRRAVPGSGGTLSEQDIEDAAAIGDYSDEELVAAIHFGTLDDFLDDVSEFVAAQRVDTLPAMPESGGARSRRRGSRTRMAALSSIATLAAAVVVALWFGAGTWSEERHERGSSSEYGAAVDRAASRGKDPHQARRAARSAARSPAEVQPDPKPLPQPEPDTDLAEVEPSSTRDPVARMSQQRRLERLDAEARTLWKAGELAAAQRKFESLVLAGGRGPVADIAYGDLFSIARNRNDRRGLRRHWRRYVKVFPAGRYLDDARAGLCRTANVSSERRSCWKAYLEDRPQGTYHQHARDFLSRPE